MRGATQRNIYSSSLLCDHLGDQSQPCIQVQASSDQHKSEDWILKKGSAGVLSCSSRKHLATLITQVSVGLGW